MQQTFLHSNEAHPQSAHVDHIYHKEGKIFILRPREKKTGSHLSKGIQMKKPPRPNASVVLAFCMPKHIVLQATRIAIGAQNWVEKLREPYHPTSAV